MRRFWQALALASVVFAPQAANASVNAFEDEAVLPANTWQSNSVLGHFPNTHRVVASSVATLGADEQSWLTQYTQSICYGLTDRVMLRASVPFSYQVGGAGTSTMGLADMELFAKAMVMGDDTTPFVMSLAFQSFIPTANPSGFATNGSYNLTPSVIIKQEMGPGNLIASVGYTYPTDQTQGSSRVHPCDTITYAAGYTWDLNPILNLTLDAVGTQVLASTTDGTADPNSTFSTALICPGLTWNISDSQALMLSLQAPITRQGDIASSQPYLAFLQFDQNF